VPYSKTLLLFLSIVFLLTKSAVYLWFIQIVNRFDIHEVAKLSYPAALSIAVVWMLLMFAVLHSVLSYYHLLGRFVQLATAFVAMDCLLTVLFLVWLTGLSFLHLPLTLTAGTIGIVLGFVLMMYWQFMVYIHILVLGMDVSILKAAIFTLFYMLLQH